MAGLGVAAVLDQVTSHASSLGLFDTVNGHEPKSAPTGGASGLTAAVWADAVDSISAGLALTGSRLVFNIRLYTSMTAPPLDAIDPKIVDAVDQLMAAYNGAFTLNGLIREVDVFGANGPGLSARAGYINQDGKLMRVMTITLPLIVNDVWTQTP
jgi:hypothetical protein